MNGLPGACDGFIICGAPASDTRVERSAALRPRCHERNLRDQRAMRPDRAAVGAEAMVVVMGATRHLTEETR